MAKYTQHEDRETRLEASKAVAKFFKDNLEQFDNLFDKLIKVRTRIAKKLGFENFVEVAYLRYAVQTILLKMLLTIENKY